MCMQIVIRKGEPILTDPAIEQTTLSDLVEMDKTYEARIALRRSVTTSHPHETLACLPGAEPMVSELYTWLFTTYLPLRFPSMFTLLPSKTHPQPFNLVTSEAIPFPAPSPIEALNLISSHIDTDFLILAPRPLPSSDQEPYHLLAFANAFPSGFSPRDKLGLPLNKIHAPVPGYPTKLEKSMDRFFARIPTGHIVKRANWTVTTEDKLFCLKGNHFTADDGVRHETGSLSAPVPVPGSDTKASDTTRLDAEIARQKAAVRVEDCRLRAERQTLHRLPRTGALVFAFKTYLYPLDEVKAEPGMAEALAEAIEGLGLGSVPEMKTYKRQVVWGEKVCEYLRS
ncbi:hypothetical protein CAC42_4264 [Sphaceloma murrayae]|uniref:Uncharacterized protein n=1 Tax=Sphaceloma murrayae TaxID=2082308 RepID=A0A2K1QLH5_9PEZI|nr:hypothetical protein CAC42_4264 [Sphaceloma murrayae]